jgi:hypothetical protein
MSGYIDLHVDIIKGGMDKYAMVNPIFKPGPVEPRYSEYLVFEGISVDEFTGQQYYMDAHVAYRRAVLRLKVASAALWIFPMLAALLLYRQKFSRWIFCRLNYRIYAATLVGGLAMPTLPPQIV